MDFTSWTPRMLSVLRIVTGLLFLEHGTGKLLGFPPSDHAAPTLFSLVGVQGALELVGGFLILIGLFTRPVAFVLAGDMAVAYFMAHAPKSFFPTLNGGQLAILFWFVFLYLAVTGGGEWSADGQLARARARWPSDQAKDSNLPAYD
jgi:putative oxidoreductase